MTCCDSLGIFLGQQSLSIFNVDSLSNDVQRWILVGCSMLQPPWIVPEFLCCRDSSTCMAGKGIAFWGALGNHPPLCQSHLSSTGIKGLLLLYGCIGSCQLEFWGSMAGMKKNDDPSMFFLDFWDFRSMFRLSPWLFPRASERWVLPIVGACISSSHLHICSSSHLIFTSAHLHTFTYSHLLFLSLALTSSHTHIFSLSLSSFLFPLSFLSPFSLSCLLYLSLFRPRVVPAGSHETSTLSHEMRIDRQKLRKNCDFTYPFRTKWRLVRKNWGKIAILLVQEQPFRTKWGSIVKNCGKLSILLVPEQPFRTKRCSMFDVEKPR